MSPPTIQRLVETLWPSNSDGAVFAILDAARDARVLPAVTASGLPQQCLYEGTLAPSLAAAAPYIVELHRDAPASRELMTLAWGHAWGIFVCAPSNLANTRRHLRRFLRVRDESGRHLIFRYYDPRVLRAYLPTCTTEELEYVFGPIERFVTEGEHTESVNEYHRVRGQLVARTGTQDKPLRWLGRYLRDGGFNPSEAK